MYEHKAKLMLVVLPSLLLGLASSPEPPEGNFINTLLNYIKKVSIQTDPLDLNPEIAETVFLEVPFTSQAPHGDWRMPYQEACEEASIIMVAHYLKGEDLSPNIADAEITKLIDFENLNNYGVDIGAADSLAIAENVYGLQGRVYYEDDVTTENIKKLLNLGYPVTIPVAGRILNNPNYVGEGPMYHMIVIVGYNNYGFLSHDPGTQFGENYLYSYDIIENAIHDWNGSKQTVISGPKAMQILLTE